MFIARGGVSWVEVVGTCANVVIAVVAVFGVMIARWWMQPALRIKFEDPFIDITPSRERITHSMRVMNVGRSEAQNVQVFVASMRRWSAHTSGAKDDRQDELPITPQNLVWANRRPVDVDIVSGRDEGHAVMSSIPAGTFRQCSFAVLSAPVGDDDQTLYARGTRRIDVIGDLFADERGLEGGRYRMDLWVSAMNVAAVHYQIVFDIHSHFQIVNVTRVPTYLRSKSKHRGNESS